MRLLRGRDETILALIHLLSLAFILKFQALVAQLCELPLQQLDGFVFGSSLVISLDLIQLLGIGSSKCSRQSKAKTSTAKTYICNGVSI